MNATDVEEFELAEELKEMYLLKRSLSKRKFFVLSSLETLVSSKRDVYASTSQDLPGVTCIS